MGDFPDGSKLVEAISGKWYRFPGHFRKGTFLLDISDTVLLDVYKDAGRIDIYSKDKNDVFTYIGDVSFLSEDGLPTLHLHSPAIKQIHFRDKDHVISNDLGNILSIMVNFDHSG